MKDYFDDVPDLKEKHLCHRCIGDEFYKAKVRKSGKGADCDYCGKHLRCFELSAVAGDVAGVFDEHYYRTRDPDYYGDRPGDDVVYAIADCGGFPDEAASDIQKSLEEYHVDMEMAQMGEECEFDADSYYAQKGVDLRNWEEQWLELRNSLKTRSRFFNSQAVKVLEDMLKDLESLPTHDGRDLIRSAGPETDFPHLYRARTFQSIPALKAA
ncbi:MAG: hypothetical protein B7Z26_05490, partial [Asticcacaulis sp. 32-58-5]